MADDDVVISATEASRAFSDILSRVAYSGESFLIKKGNRIMARITPVMALVEEPQITQVAPPVPVIVSASQPPSQGVTQEEEAYFLSVLERIRANSLENCD